MLFLVLGEGVTTFYPNEIPYVSLEHTILFVFREHLNHRANTVMDLREIFEFLPLFINRVPLDSLLEIIPQQFIGVLPFGLVASVFLGQHSAFEKVAADIARVQTLRAGLTKILVAVVMASEEFRPTFDFDFAISTRDGFLVSLI